MNWISKKNLGTYRWYEENAILDDMALDVKVVYEWVKTNIVIFYVLCKSKYSSVNVICQTYDIQYIDVQKWKSIWGRTYDIKYIGRKW